MGLRSFIIGMLGLTMVFGCAKDSPKRVQKGGPGEAATSFLRDDRYEKVVVEIAYPIEFAPTEQALVKLKTFILDRCHKPQGVDFVLNEIFLPSKARSASDIQELEDEYRSTKARKDVLSLWIFFNNGGSPSDTDEGQVLGIAYGATSLAIYEETIRRYSGGVFQPSLEDAETTVLKHELGHLLGLVNNGTRMRMNHQDVAHGKHCDVSGCLMNWAVETNQVFSLISGGELFLDDRCREDLRDNGGK